MSPVWEELPNSVHIHRILNSLKINTDRWSEQYAIIWPEHIGFEVNTQQKSAWEITKNIIREKERMPHWNSGYRSILCHVTPHYAQSVAWTIIATLMAYDDCAHMLDSDPDEIKILAALGDTRAVLLLPACIILSSTSNVVIDN